MSNKQKRKQTTKVIMESASYKKQKREVVSACAELLAKIELENELLAKAIKFWRYVAVGLFLTVLALICFIVV